MTFVESPNKAKLVTIILFLLTNDFCKRSLMKHHQLMWAGKETTNEGEGRGMVINQKPHCLCYGDLLPELNRLCHNHIVPYIRPHLSNTESRIDQALRLNDCLRSNIYCILTPQPPN